MAGLALAGELAELGEATGLISNETAGWVTGATGAVGGVVAVAEGFNQAINRGNLRNGKQPAVVTPASSSRTSVLTPASSSSLIGIRRSINFSTPEGERATDIELAAVANSNASAQSSSAMQVGNDHEVPVAKVPRLIAKIHPDVFNIRLPYYDTFTIRNDQIEISNDQALCYIRLNSIYDVMKNSVNEKSYGVNPYTTLSSAATTAANANDPVASAVTTANPPRYDADEGPVGRNVWQGHFKYYRVLRSDVKLTFINVNCERTVDATNLPSLVGIKPIHNMYAVGYELIDEDALICQNSQAFMTAKGVVRDILAPAAFGERIPVTGGTQSVFACAKPSIGVMQYTYHPANWTQHVEQKGVETRWTAVGANPALDHLMAVRAFHLDNSPQTYTTAEGFQVIVQIEYEVQFRECLDNFIKEGYQAQTSDT